MRPAYLCLPSPGIKGGCHQTLLLKNETDGNQQRKICRLGRNEKLLKRVLDCAVMKFDGARL